MPKSLKMPTKDELAELSHAEISEHIQIAFDQWVEALKRGESGTEMKDIHRAYDNEQLNRLHRMKKYLPYYEERDETRR